MEDDMSLTFFETKVKSDNETWYDKFLNLLSNENEYYRKVKCTGLLNKLNDCFSLFYTCKNYNYKNNLTPLKVIDEKKTKYQTLYTITPSFSPIANFNRWQYYFFDRVKMTRRSGKFGEYFELKWPGLYKLNHSYGKAMEQHLNGKVIMKDKINLKFSTKNNGVTDGAALLVFIRRFFEITRKQNEYVYLTGQLNDDTHIIANPMTLLSFNSTFSINVEIEMVMGAVIEGVKETKNQMESVKPLNSKTSTTTRASTFSLAFKPVVFLKIE
ncbi:dbp-1 [Hemileuca sp. nucleopolyhedrovirus]|uniref:Dbp-1 n=1 Tax=Hemileuca sp. nucleopolyhedrovirus TaxID=1367203 RepID=S5MJZ6_9ABAC|nr:dbp-1 [Hemileuca sp. nucleopolyhedrovirus]AGR56771.1 dbp-1 [Hemileuca sp. nucleopolyhedrovirus]